MTRGQSHPTVHIHSSNSTGQHIHDAILNTSTDQWAPRYFVCIQTAGAYSTSISPQNHQTPQSSPRSVNSADAGSETAAVGCGRRSSRRQRRLIAVHFDVYLRARLMRMNLEWGGSFTKQVREDEQCSWRCTFVLSAKWNPCLVSWCKVRVQLQFQLRLLGYQANKSSLPECRSV